MGCLFYILCRISCFCLQSAFCSVLDFYPSMFAVAWTVVESGSELVSQGPHSRLQDAAAWLVTVLVGVFSAGVILHLKVTKAVF